jgi:hypothetical protein
VRQTTPRTTERPFPLEQRFESGCVTVGGLNGNRNLHLRAPFRLPRGSRNTHWNSEGDLRTSEFNSGRLTGAEILWHSYFFLQYLPHASEASADLGFDVIPRRKQTGNGTPHISPRFRSDHNFGLCSVHCQ